MTQAFLLVASLFFVETPSKSVPDLIRMLDAKRPKAERLEAAGLLRELKDTDATKAMLALSAGTKDADAEIREAMLNALAEIAWREKLACPIEIVEALIDKELSVRETAIPWIGPWVKYPDKAFDLFREALKHKEPEVRSCALFPLTRFAGKEKEALADLRKATTDEHWLVRWDAYQAIWIMTKDLELLTPQWLMAVEKFPDVKRSQEPKRAELEKAQIDLIQLAAILRIRELGADKPADFGAVLIKLLADPSPVIRRAAARTLGAIAGESAKSKAVFQEMKAEATLRKLLDDEDESVRVNAFVALERFQK